MNLVRVSEPCTVPYVRAALHSSTVRAVRYGTLWAMNSTYSTLILTSTHTHTHTQTYPFCATRPLCCTPLSYTAEFFAALFCTIWLHYTAPYHTILYSSVLYCAPDCIVIVDMSAFPTIHMSVRAYACVFVWECDSMCLCVCASVYAYECVCHIT